MKSKPLKIIVRLKDRSYPISIGHGFTDQLGPLLNGLPSKNAHVISDISLKKIRFEFIKSLKRAHWNVKEIPVKAGESLKDFQKTNELYGKLLSQGAHRDSVLFALGGGSVGDAAGFVASTYLRGMAWVGVPTTLLAQVDSSVGGKTAINHRHGKNLIGTFFQPSKVICDVSYLKTLSKREIISGLGEALKYGLIYDPKFFGYIKAHWKQILSGEPKTLTTIVHKSLLWKSQVVSKDEFDKKGTREFLNFGHTFGHALEKITEYKSFQHGEAIIWGMRFALALGRVRGVISKLHYQEIDSFLSSVKVPALPKNMTVQQILKLISKDKKIRKGRLHFVLLRKLGSPVSDPTVTKKDLSNALQLIKSKA